MRIQPNELVPGALLLAVVFGGWQLIRFVRARSKLFKPVGLFGGAAFVKGMRQDTESRVHLALRKFESDLDDSCICGNLLQCEIQRTLN